jgi:hypothetical protein
VNPVSNPLANTSFFPAQFALAEMRSQVATEPVSVTLNSGLTIFIGPNGSGKTRALRAVRSELKAKLAQSGRALSVRYIGAGRAAPFEIFRSASFSLGANSEPAAVGHRSLTARRLEIESLVGDIMALEERVDLRIKVEARLYALFHRRMKLRWSQAGIEISFQSGGLEYAANTEASGILHLVGLLAALYDDTIGGLLIDEPEVSLHPQLQAFLFAEIRRVAGNPLEGAPKKVIVCATHSLSMLPLRDISELPNLVFFSTPNQNPRQVAPDAGELQSRKLGALVVRLGEGHRAAFFAETAFLVEGPSDEIVVSMLSARLGRELGGSGTQVVPVIGKGEFPETVRLFRLMGKRVVILADLDALVDSNAVAMSFAEDDELKHAVVFRGFGSLAAIDGTLRTELARIVTDCWCEIEHLTPAASRRNTDDAEALSAQTMRRLALGVLLSNEVEKLAMLPSGERWCELKTRFQALLAILEAGGCFFLRKGAIEAYYDTASRIVASDKSEAAVDEAACFASSDEVTLRQRYGDVWRAIEFAAPSPTVDENSLLRSLLAALIAAVFQEMTIDTSDAELASMAATVHESAARIFHLENVSDQGTRVRALRVSIVSPLFQRATFPATIGYDENPHTAVVRLFQ